MNLPATAPKPERIQIGDGKFYQPAQGELHSVLDGHAELEDVKSQMGSFKFSAQYQQDLLPQEGEIIKWKRFQLYDSLPSLGLNHQIVQSWDTASMAKDSSDYSVCTTWFVQDNQYYLVDVLRQKLLYPDLKRLVIDHALRYGANVVIIEEKGSGISSIQDLRESSIISPISFRPDGDKIERMSAQSPKIEGGQVHLPRQAS